jgi:hypothetical protein
MSRRWEFYGRQGRNTQHHIRSKTPCSTVVRRSVKRGGEGEVRREDDVETG